MAASLQAVKLSYYTSALFSLTVLVLSLLDLGTLSFYLDIVVPCFTLIHHITLFIIHRFRQDKTTLLSTLPSYSLNVVNLTLLCILAILWMGATGMIFAVASEIWSHHKDILSEEVETRVSAVPQVVFAALECALVWGMFGVGVHERKRSRVEHHTANRYDKSHHDAETNFVVLRRVGPVHEIASKSTGI